MGSICVGLPYTFFICFMCLALWRALQYETKDRAWKGNYFSSEITDIGVTVYTASAGTSKVFNGRLGSIQFKKFFNCRLRSMPARCAVAKRDPVGTKERTWPVLR